MALNGSLSYTVSPSMAEALTCHEALLWLHHHRLDHVILESNSLEVISKLSATSPPLMDSILSVVLANCLELLSLLFDILLQHIQRSANKAAHLLARVIDVSFPFSESRKEWLCIPFFTDVILLEHAQ